MYDPPLPVHTLFNNQNVSKAMPLTTKTSDIERPAGRPRCGDKTWTDFLFSRNVSDYWHKTMENGLCAEAP